MSEGATVAVRVLVSGRVQGVWFRHWTRTQAEARGLSGWVRNLRDGRVEALFQGPAAGIESMVAACHEGPPAAWVTEVERFAAAPVAEGDFQVRPSGQGPESGPVAGA